MRFDQDQAAWFIENVIAKDGRGGVIEVRGIEGGRIVRSFHDTTQPHLIDPILGRLESLTYDGYNVFMGCVLRDFDHNPSYANCLWIDIDFKDRKSDGLIDTMTTEIIRLVTSPFPPSVLIDSGHGLHAYWVLHDTFYADMDMLKDNLKRLATYFNADRTYDVARIMRVPGTDNVKDKQNIVPCRVLNYPNVGILREWDFNTLAGLLAKHVPVAPISDKLMSFIAGNTKSFKSRSEADFAVIRELLSLGRDENDITAIYQNEPIGEKFREKGPFRYDYLNHTIAAAAASLEGAK